MPEPAVNDYIEPPPQGWVPNGAAAADTFGLPPPKRSQSPAPPQQPGPPDRVIPTEPPPIAPFLPIAFKAGDATQLGAPVQSDAPPAHPETRPVGVSGSPVRVSGKPAREEVEAFIIQQGKSQYNVDIPQHVAAGIVDRAQAESGLNPTSFVQNDVNGPSGGMLQHHNERLANLAQYARDHNAAPYDWRVQMSYGLHEWLGGGDAQAFANRDKILNAPDRQTAGTAWDRYFERSANGPGSMRAWATGVSPELRARADAIEGEAGRLRDQYHTDAQEIIRQANAAPPGSRERDAAIDRLREREREYMDKYEAISAHPPVMKPVDALANFGSAGTIIALLGGLFARRHMTAALSAAGSAMQAINQNNWDQFQIQFKTWEQQSHTALEMVRLHNEQIRELIDDKKMAVDEKNARLRTTFETLNMQRQADSMSLGVSERMLSDQMALERNQQAAAQARLQFQQSWAASLIAQGVPEEEAYRRAGLIPHGSASGTTPKNIQVTDKDGKVIYSGMATYNPSTRQYTPVGGGEPFPADAKVQPGPTAVNQATTTKGDEAAIEQETKRRDSQFLKDNPNATDDEKDKAHYENRLAVRKELGAATRQPRSAPAMALQKFIEERTAAGKPPSSEEIQTFSATTAEKTAEGRTVGTRSASLEMAANAADAIIPLLEAKSNEINRTEYPDINRLIIAAETKTGDPKVVQYGELMNSMRYLYARALSPTGQARVADIQHFDEIMNPAWSKGQVAAGLEQIKQSLAAEKGAIAKTRSEVSGGGVPAPSAASAPATATYKSPDDVLKALDKGDLSETDAKRIMIDQFGYKEKQ